jgi:hypothetical protein
MAELFVSYRRADSAGEAGRLVDSLATEIGRGFAFRDVVGLLPGERFDHALEQAIHRAEVVLVLIGPDWLPELQRRQARPDIDYVRAEVALALQLGKRVVPVLLGSTPMPAAAHLPDDMKPLAMCHAIGLRDEAWAQDVARLADAIGRPYRFDRLLWRMLLAPPLLLLAGWQLAPLLFAQRVSDYAFTRHLLLAVALAYALAEAAWAWHHRRRLKARRLRGTAPARSPAGSSLKAGAS